MSRRCFSTWRTPAPGVPEDDLERIFDVYETKAGEEARGVGLGLPLSRRLARLLGGDLFAEARPAGGGHFVLDSPGYEHMK